MAMIKQIVKGTSANEEYMVMISPGLGIGIGKTAGQGAGKKIAFKIGDMCVRGSYNLIYLGVITQISEKCVTMVDQYAFGKLGAKKQMMKIAEFCWRNYDFDLARIAKENAETSMCI